MTTRIQVIEKKKNEMADVHFLCSYKISQCRAQCVGTDRQAQQDSHTLIINSTLLIAQIAITLTMIKLGSRNMACRVLQINGTDVFLKKNIKKLIYLKINGGQMGLLA